MLTQSAITVVNIFVKTVLLPDLNFTIVNSRNASKNLRKILKKHAYRKEITCPDCQSVIKVSAEELQSGGFRCPECETYIAIVNGKPEAEEDKNYVKLLSSLNQGDIALIKSMLDDAEIDYYAAGENFLSVRPLLEPVLFYVNEKDLELAKEILKDFNLHLFGFSVNNEEEQE